MILNRALWRGLWGGTLHIRRDGSAFEQSGAFAVGLIFLPNIFQLILGFGNYAYIGPAVADNKN